VTTIETIELLERIHGDLGEHYREAADHIADAIAALKDEVGGPPFIWPPPSSLRPGPLTTVKRRNRRRQVIA
jgi:hypothetical protein